MNDTQQPVLNRPKPVFFDNSGHRWKFCMAVLFAVAFILVVSASLFVASLFHTPNFSPIKIDEGNFCSRTSAMTKKDLKVRS